jgi:hypothetical protein
MSDEPVIIDEDDLRAAINDLLFSIEVDVHKLMKSLANLKKESEGYDFTDLKLVRAQLVLLSVILESLRGHFNYTEED